jgi:hypothetical protein
MAFSSVGISNVVLTMPAEVAAFFLGGTGLVNALSGFLGSVVVDLGAGFVATLFFTVMFGRVVAGFNVFKSFVVVIGADFVLGFGTVFVIGGLIGCLIGRAVLMRGAGMAALDWIGVDVLVEALGFTIDREAGFAVVAMRGVKAFCTGVGVVVDEVVRGAGFLATTAGTGFFGWRVTSKRGGLPRVATLGNLGAGRCGFGAEVEGVLLRLALALILEPDGTGLCVAFWRLALVAAVSDR